MQRNNVEFKCTHPWIIAHSSNDMSQERAELFDGQLSHGWRSRLRVFCFQDGRTLSAYPILRRRLRTTTHASTMPSTRTSCTLTVYRLFVTTPTEFIFVAFRPLTFIQSLAFFSWRISSVYAVRDIFSYK